MLPFLKDRHEGGMSGPVEVEHRAPDGDESYGMLDAIAEDLIKAVDKKDKKLLKEALQALCDHIKEEDEVQDADLEE